MANIPKHFKYKGLKSSPEICWRIVGLSLSVSLPSPPLVIGSCIHIFLPGLDRNTYDYFLPLALRKQGECCFLLCCVGICYCAEQPRPLEVTFVANKIANKIIVMRACTNWMLTLCQNVEKDFLVLSDLILSTDISSPFYSASYSWERLTYLPKLGVEFSPSVWNYYFVLMKFPIVYLFFGH